MFKYYFWKLFDSIFGHVWGDWSKPKQDFFVNIADRSRRFCYRCFKNEYRDWTPKELVIVRRNQKRTGKALSAGVMGELHGVRFIESSGRGE